MMLTRFLETRPPEEGGNERRAVWSANLFPSTLLIRKAQRRPMAKSSINLQDSFLNQVRKDNAEIKLVLIDGTNLSGHVRGFDNFTVVLASRGSQHLIYKHAIAQIISRRTPMKRDEAKDPTQKQNSEETDSSPSDQAEPAPAKSGGFNTLNLSNVVISEESKT
jgi:host factor-I protein